MDSMDYWRLADELSVIDAAILITGNDPSETYRDDENRLVQRTYYDGFDAALKALRLAVFANKIRAKFGFKARSVGEVEHVAYFGGEPVYYKSDVDWTGDEIKVFFSELVKVSGGVEVLTNRNLANLSAADAIFIISEQNWHQTTIEVDELKRWLESRGVYPSFFFPQQRVDGFRQASNPRYAPKLACAVAAWEAVRAAKPNKSVKQTVEEWVTANAVRFEMVGSDGVPTGEAVKQVAAVVNWQPGGGANQTTGSRDAGFGDAEPEVNDQEPTQNFDKFGFFAEGDDDLPF